MNKYAYVEEIAKEIGGKVQKVTKVNGIEYVGILIGDGEIQPCVYIDDAYEKGASVKETAEWIKETAERASIPNIPKVNSYEEIKDKLRLRLYNGKTPAEVSEPYLDDLILIPYIEFGVMEDGSMASSKVASWMLSEWGKTKEEVMAQARENTTGCFIKPMAQIMAEMMGMEYDPEMDDGRMYTITNATKLNGAVGVALLEDELREKFPNGYYVIPSSIHEIIILPDNGEIELEDLNYMVESVNAEQLRPEEILSDHAYYVEGVA